jgi:hypothetical protein
MSSCSPGDYRESTFVPISDFICSNAQEAKRAAGLENARP